MNAAVAHPGPALAPALAQRFAELALPLVSVDADGRLLERRADGCALLPRLVIESRLFARALRRLAERWRDAASEPTDPALLWPGCWALPLPTGRRRRTPALCVAVLVTETMLDSEQFHRIADDAGYDIAGLRQLIRDEHLLDASEARGYARLLPAMARDLLQQDRSHAEIDSLSQQLAETYEELSLVYKLSARMTVSRAPGVFLEEALDELQEVVGLRWLALQLVEDDPRLGAMAGRLVTVGRPPVEPVALRRIGAGALHRMDRYETPKIIHAGGPWQNSDVADLAEQVLLVPLVGDDKPLGVILGAEKHDGSELSSIDSKLVTSIAQNVAIFVENAMLYEDLQGMFMGMLRSLVNAIDAKDTYTCGHSERVAWLGRELGKAAGLDEPTVERLHLSGLLHDVGKIGVPESVLTKPGKLTDREFTIIKAHPRIGARIVEGVRQMQDLIPGVLYHHERYDGRGYPEGLAGEDIPLFGRLLGLADSFDAMSSNRTYRTAMPLDDVLEEIRRCAGSQFDPELAEVFMTLDFKPFQEMVQTHQQRQSLLRREVGDLA